MNADRAFEQLLHRIHGEPHAVVAVSERRGGAQGYSGSQVSYFDVTSTSPNGAAHHTPMVVKNASLLERRIVHRLGQQDCAVPPAIIPDLDGPDRAPLYMPYLEPRPTLYEGYAGAITTSMAEGLAGIHAANLGQQPPWLPRTGDDLPGRLWLKAWHEQWEANLAEPDFAAEFGAYTTRLVEADDQLLRHLKALVQEGTTLTLLNVDLIPDHIRLWQGRACFIDWEQSSYGPLYLDLPNAFTIETALAYRDALARLSHAIGEVEFLERFHAVSPYMGLRYLGFALWQWAQGGAERQRGRWFLYYTLHLALYGR